MIILKLIAIVSSVYVIKFVKTEEISTNFSNLTESVKKSLTESVNNTSTTNALPSTTSTLNIINDIETTSSWELIYPDQHSTSTVQTFTDSVDDKFALSSTNSTIVPPAAVSLPNYFKVDDVLNCEKYFGECLRQVLSNVLPKLKNGYQELKIPAIDPMIFNPTAFKFNSGPFTGHITLRQAFIYGLTTMKFKKLDFYKLENKKFKARLLTVVPRMEAIGSYKGDLQINNVRVRPKGDFNVTMTGLYMDVICSGLFYEKDKHQFLKFTKNNVTTTFKDSKINATGIFPDQRLNDIVVNVANQYWRELFNVALPETQNYWSPILLNAFNTALSMVPFDFIK